MCKNNRVVLLGYHNMGCIALKVLKELGLQIPAVFTHRDDPSERRWFDSLAKVAEGYDIPVYYADNINDPVWTLQVKKMAPDVLLSCYFRQMISDKILCIPKIAALNLHGSLLPKYRGRCPVNWQIIHGETRGGVTLHHMVRNPDAGDIVAQKEIEILHTDTALSLFKKLESAAETLLREALPAVLDGTAPRIAQDHTKASYFGGRRPDDGRINWSWPVKRIYNLIRAVTWPYPGAFTFAGGRKLMIWWAEPIECDNYGLEPGSVIRKQDQWLVQSGQGVLQIIRAGFQQDAPEGIDGLEAVLKDRMRLQ